MLLAKNLSMNVKNIQHKRKENGQDNIGLVETMINYPNKKVVNKQEQNSLASQKKHKVLSAANRGMDFEHAVSLS